MKLLKEKYSTAKSNDNKLIGREGRVGKSWEITWFKLDQGTLGMSDPSQVNLHQGHQGHQGHQAIRTTKTNKKTDENNGKQ